MFHGMLVFFDCWRHLTKTSNPTRFSTSASDRIQSKLQTRLPNQFPISSPTASSSRTSASVQPNAIPSHKWLHTTAMVPQVQWLFNFLCPTQFFVPKPQSSTSLLFTPSQRAWFPFTWTLSSHSLLGDMRPPEFTMMINLSPSERPYWSYSVFIKEASYFDSLSSNDLL